MQTGDTVTIYKNPLTCVRKEGRAKLVNFVKDIELEPQCELWQVMFIEDASLTTRIVNTKHH